MLLINLLSPASLRGAESTGHLDQIIKAIMLGIIQGLTEWLPISSTGHLRVFESFMGLEVPILFDVILHIGTLVVVCFFFKDDILRILSSLFKLDFKTQDGSIAPLIVVGTIPTVLIGLIFGGLVEDVFRGTLPIGLAFLVWGTILYSSRAGREYKGKVDLATALVIGIAQGVAIVPGISRSGATIAAALLLGVKRDKAFRFSFLLSVPAILMALFFTVYTQFEALVFSGIGWSEILAGAAAAMLVGYSALRLLERILRRGWFHRFAVYCWLLGGSLISFSVLQPFSH